MVKELVLLIKSNLKTFISIILLTILGVGFYVGMKVSVVDLKKTVDDYYEKNNVYDIVLSSPLGFLEDDFIELNKIKEIISIEKANISDGIINKGNSSYVVRLHSYDEDNTINKLEVIKGNLPNSDDEIVLEDKLFKKMKYKIGDYISIDNDYLKNNKLKIVGVIKSPLYLSNDKGQSNLLSGKVNYYAYIYHSNFNKDKYSDYYIKLKNNTKLDDVVSEVKEIISNTFEVKYASTISEYTNTLSEKENEFKLKKEEFNNQINYYQEQIDNAELMIKSAENNIPSITEAEAILHNKKLEANKIKVKLDNARNQINQSEAEYNTKLNEYNLAKSEMDSCYQDIPDDGSGFEELVNLFCASIRAQLSSAKAELDSAKLAIDAANAEYNATLNEYNRVVNSLNSKTPHEYIENAKKEIDIKKAELEAKKIEFNNKKEEYTKLLNDYETQIADYKDYLKYISSNGLSISLREDNSVYNQYLNDINRIKKISNFFPVIFFIVAVLITLTNITRIIEKDRKKIGIYKSLGYTKKYIGFSYVLFTLSASVFGSVLGSIIGTLLIPKVFYRIYLMMYYLPKSVVVFDFNLILSAFLIVNILLLISCLISIRSVLKEWPVSLFRPKINNKYKRIILEKIKFIWNRFDFTKKVTFRNMLKNKKVFFMTIFGVIGCVILILSGFNLRSSISNIIPLQYEKLFDIDVEIFLRDSLTRSETNLEKERINNIEEVKTSILTMLNYSYINDYDKPLYLVVPEDHDLLLDYVTLEDNGKRLELSDDGAIITRKISKVLNIKVGDTIKVKDINNNVFKVKISGITDNYVDNYLYIKKELYNKLINDTVKFNTLLVKLNGSVDEAKLSEKFNEKETISYLTYTSYAEKVYQNLSKTLNNIVYVLIISAIILSFTVLFNLNNLNIEERKIEIATLKVLGFNKKQIYRYIENEIRLLTFIGIIFGLIFGYFFSNIIIGACELENVMYDYSINYLNYILAVVITCVFSMITSYLCRRHIRDINMIESLKQVE